MNEEELKAIEFIDKNLDNMKRELKEIEKENEANCIVAIEHLRYQIYHLEIIKYLIENSISKDKIKDKIKEYLDFDKKYKTYTKDGRENFSMEYFKARALQELLEEKNMEDKVVKKCHWCGNELYDKDIEELGNARGYGYYITCKNCGKENVIQEIEL